MITQTDPCVSHSPQHQHSIECWLASWAAPLLTQLLPMHLGKPLHQETRDRWSSWLLVWAWSSQAPVIAIWEVRQ